MDYNSHAPNRTVDEEWADLHHQQLVRVSAEHHRYTASQGQALSLGDPVVGHDPGEAVWRRQTEWDLRLGQEAGADAERDENHQASASPLSHDLPAGDANDHPGR